MIDVQAVYDQEVKKNVAKREKRENEIYKFGEEVARPMFSEFFGKLSIFTTKNDYILTNETKDLNVEEDGDNYTVSYSYGTRLCSTAVRLYVSAEATFNKDNGISYQLKYRFKDSDKVSYFNNCDKEKLFDDFFLAFIPEVVERQFPTK